MGKFNDLTGQRFGQLMVIEKIEKDKFGNIQWLCECDCGNKKIVPQSRLKNNKTKSCGCLAKKNSIKDITNKKFGKLTVQKYLGESKWLCVCECGKEKIVTTGSLQSGKTKSCGCIKTEILQERNKNNFIEDRVNLFIDRIYYSYKKGAKIRHIKFELEKNFFAKIINEKCYYCGSEPDNLWTIKKESYKYNGIDRIDPSKGYAEDNIVTSCGKCNMGKKEMSQQDFLSWVERVYNHSIKGEKND